MSLDSVQKMLRDNQINPDSALGQKLIQKYENELKSRRENLKMLEAKIVTLAEEDFLNSIEG